MIPQNLLLQASRGISTGIYEGTAASLSAAAIDINASARGLVCAPINQ
jgi:hypothetical protein